jgi:hypothetical protein
MPIRARIALFGAAVVALTVLIFGVLVYVLLERNLDSQQDKELALSGQELVRRLQRDRSPVDYLSPGLQLSRIPVDLRSSTDTYREILDAAGTPGSAPVNSMETRRACRPLSCRPRAPMWCGRTSTWRAASGCACSSLRGRAEASAAS